MVKAVEYEISKHKNCLLPLKSLRFPDISLVTLEFSTITKEQRKPSKINLIRH